MPRYAYAVRDSRGQTVRGSVEAESTAVAAARLRAEGYYVTSIGADTGTDATSRAVASAGVKVNARTLGIFCQQVGTLLTAGVPITNALNVVVSQPGKRGWNEVVERVRRYVEAGESLSGALSHYRRTFPNLLIRLVEAGEASGTLDKTFERLGDHYVKEHELRQKVVGSLTYPAIIICVAFAVIVILLLFVLPSFVDMFSSMGTELPLPTKIVMAVGDVAKANGLFILTGLVALIVGLTLWTRTEPGAKARDAFLLRLPLIRNLVLQMEVARFGHTFGTLLAGGVPALQGMQISARVANNRSVAAAFDQVASAVRGGATLAGSMEKTGILPPMMVQMVAVGESTGSLDMILDNIAGLYDREVEARLKQLTTLIEPAVILVVGVIVAVIVSSVMLPMFDSLKSFQ